MIRFPKLISDLSGATGTFRAGGTDLEDRRRRSLMLSSTPVKRERLVTDLRDFEEGQGIDIGENGRVRIGAMSTIHEIAHHPQLQSHQGLVQAAAGLATPAIRRVARLGGNLLQQVRCPYPRQAGFSCLRTGGEGCPARSGDLLYHALVDLGGCIAPHPSTLATALLAWDAQALVISVGPERERAIEKDKASEPWRKISLKALFDRATAALPVPHGLSGDEFLLAVELPPANHIQRSGWKRISSRRHSEWPLVEVVICFERGEDNRLENVRIAVGGLAPIPLRLSLLEEHLNGTSSLVTVAERIEETQIFSQTLRAMSYKEKLLQQALLDLWEELLTSEAM